MIDRNGLLVSGRRGGGGGRATAMRAASASDDDFSALGQPGDRDVRYSTHANGTKLN